MGGITGRKKGTLKIDRLGCGGNDENKLPSHNREVSLFLTSAQIRPSGVSFSCVMSTFRPRKSDSADTSSM